MAPKKKIDINARIASRMKKERIDQGMALDAMAKKMGISLQMAYRYETGRVAFSVARLLDFANALHVPLHYFLEDRP